MVNRPTLHRPVKKKKPAGPTDADLTLAALLAYEHGGRHQPGTEPKCPKCKEDTKDQDPGHGGLL